MDLFDNPVWADSIRRAIAEKKIKDSYNLKRKKKEIKLFRQPVVETNYDSINYFFDNHGRCPVCRKYLIHAVGCKDLECPTNSWVEEALECEDEFLREKAIQLIRINQKHQKFDKEWEVYWEYLKQCGRNYWAKIDAEKAGNVDITVKKSYSKNV